MRGVTPLEVALAAGAGIVFAAAMLRALAWIVTGR